MSKRKPTTAPKHARRPKIAAKAQRATQAIVRSPKVRLRSVAADSASSPKPRNDSTPLAIPMASPPVAPLVIENPVTALQEDFKKTMTVTSWRGFDLFSATANVRAYQAILLEMAQANMTFALEFSRRLATIRSPLEFLIVIAEFTSERIAMFGTYSKEMAELSIKRLA